MTDMTYKGRELTPAMRQYLEAKAQVPEAILLFRMGDFYELFFDDAVVAAPILEIALTTRDRGVENPIPMCGVPFHALKVYIAKLLEAGKQVALCEQMEDPALAKGIVKRDIVRIVSPGTVLDMDALDASTNNYLAAVVQGMDCLGLAYLDASTGTFRACRANDMGQLRIELSRVEPREVVFPRRQEAAMEKLRLLLEKTAMRAVDDALFDARACRDALTGLADPAGLPAEVLQAAGGVAGCLATLQRSRNLQVEPLDFYQVQNFMVLDETALADLEVMKTLSGGHRRGSLLGLMDRTSTPMGARLLKRWLAYPLVDRERIEARLDAVGELAGRSILRTELEDRLKKLHDMERLATRTVTGQASPRELLSLARSMADLADLRPLLSPCQSAEISDILRCLCDPPEPLREALVNLVEPAPLTHKEGGIFAADYNPELKHLLELRRGGKEWLLQYEVDLKERTKIGSLKVRFNRVFGYFIEVTKPNLHLVPEDFIRKQTTSTGERFFTPQLKEYEEKVLHAEERARVLEEELFLALTARVSEHRSQILQAAGAVARLDVFVGLAELAHLGNYARPTVNYSDVLELKDSRHPVLDRTMAAGRFVPNDVRVDCEKDQLLIITGPNMAGKSTVMRQAALIAVMAQMGSFVPAREATIGMVDRVFTRVGATDSLSKGLSTFMVEMKEAAEILKRSSRKSLIILDELGRGTSTYDGLSIAWAMAEYLHDFICARTLFATHYHELTQMAQYKKRVRNFNIAVKEFNDEILFLHKLVEGAANRSYGVQVARLAGIPRPVIDRAKEVLASLEEGTGDIRIERPRPVRRKRPGDAGQPDLFAAAREAQRAPEAPGFAVPAEPAVPSAADAVAGKLRSMSLDAMTPIEALNALHALKRELS